jgi:hypothetical protein
MMVRVAALLVLVLVGLPFVVLPAGFLAALAAPSAVLCAGGIATRSVPVLTAGVTLAVIEYALALWASEAPLDVPIAALFGVALFLLLELVDFLGRTRGAAVGGSVLPAMIRYWLAIAGAGAGLMVALVAGAAAVRLALPLPSDPMIAALGVLGALTAAGGVLRLVVGVDCAPGGDAHD